MPPLPQYWMFWHLRRQRSLLLQRSSRRRACYIENRSTLPRELSWIISIPTQVRHGRPRVRLAVNRNEHPSLRNQSIWKAFLVVGNVEYGKGTTIRRKVI